MVPPTFFAFNVEAAETNKFAKNILHASPHASPLAEFNNMVRTLQDEGVKVHVVQAPEGACDAVFPNNWFSTHKVGSSSVVLVYPMLNETRRLEKANLENLVSLCSNILFGDNKKCNEHDRIDVRFEDESALWEDQNRALEGTGSLVFDRKNNVAYLSKSPRSDPGIAAEMLLCGSPEDKIAQELVVFTSRDASGQEIYHTNVLMSVGTEFAVVCSEAIVDEEERRVVLNKLTKHGKDVIEISFEQMANMCGNILELCGAHNDPLVVMSSTAASSFSEDQLVKLNKYGKVLSFDIPIIECVGGGSVRCMIAELFL